MRPFLALLLCLLPCTALAQDDPLSVTLPSGKIVHFQTAEQRDAFVSARDRAKQLVTPTPSPTPNSRSRLGGTALDERPTGTGGVNISAPTFTADYYLPSADSWVGKSITLSVAYLHLHNETPRADGMKQLDAYTWGRVHTTGDQHPGGVMTILASPAAAQRLLTQCGSTLHFGSGGVQTTLIHADIAVLKTIATGQKEYGLIVDQ